MEEQLKDLAKEIQDSKNRGFYTGCIHMMMDIFRIKEYTIEDGADKLLVCRFRINNNVDVEYLKEKMRALSMYVSFVSDWDL